MELHNRFFARGNTYD